MYSDQAISFGRWLRERRLAHDLTQKELAQRCGCVPSTIRKIEADQRRPSKQVAELIATVLGVAQAELPAFLQFARGVGSAGETVTRPVAPATHSDIGSASAPPVHGAGSFSRVAAPAQTGAWTPPADGNWPSNLPYYPNSFVGRERLAEQVLALLWRVDVRLLTLTGPPGIGKTRLAIQVAVRLLGDFGDGVYFVPLAPIGDSRLIEPAIAAVLGLREGKEESLHSAIQNYLRDKNLFLLLDNFEQVIEGAAILADLLRVAPGLKILTTSRVPLELYGEHTLAVPPLELPAAEDDQGQDVVSSSEAVLLFVQRSRAVKPDFVLTAQNNDQIAAITRRLDGLPLAIELAAVRSRYYQPDTMLALLAHSLDVLTDGPRDLPARHRTLRAAIAWSYDLLDAPEQTLFRHLSVFSGGFSTTAARDVAAPAATAGDTQAFELGALNSLVDKSLLLRQDGGDGARFNMLVTIREYALEQLAAQGEADEAARRHAQHYALFAQQADSHRTGPEHGVWLARLEGEHDNLRAALQWLVEHGRDNPTAALAVLGLVCDLYDFWKARGFFSEGRAWTARALDAAQAQQLGRGDNSQKLALARAFNHAGLWAMNVADNAAARDFFGAGLELFRALQYKRGISSALINLATIAMHRAERDEALRLFGAALVVAREIGEQNHQAIALNNMGVTYWDGGDEAQALPCYRQSLAIYRAMGDKAGMSIELDNLGIVATSQKDFAAARGYYEEALVLCRELNDKDSMAQVLANRASLAVEEAEFATAAAGYRAALLLCRELGYVRVLIKCLEGAANICALTGRHQPAAQLWGAAEQLREALDHPRAVPGRAAYAARVATSRSAGEPRAFDAAWRRGRSMGEASAAAYALEHLAAPHLPAERPIGQGHLPAL